METGEVFLNNIELIKDKKIYLVGNTFYVQLFIDYNITEASKMWIVNSKGVHYWSEKVELEYINKIPEKTNENIIIFCGLEKVRDVKLMDYNFFDMDSIRENGMFYYIEYFAP